MSFTKGIHDGERAVIIVAIPQSAAILQNNSAQAMERLPQNLPLSTTYNNNEHSITIGYPP